MYLEKNIELLGKHPLHVIGEPIESDFKLRYIDTVNKVDFFENEHGEVIQVKDDFEKSQAGNPHLRQLVFALGVNSPNELNALYKTLNKTSLLVILEPNFTLFNTALGIKNLKVFDHPNVILFSHKLDQLQPFLLNLMTNFNYFSLVNNIHFYLTDYYRNNDFELTKEIIQMVRKVIRTQVHLTGNSIEDSLDGLENNLRNISKMLVSKNPHYLKDKYKGKPAIVIAAGPSLEKNIQYLKNAEGKAVILAVDTIIKKVLKMGIIPDFVCSVERVPQVYDYFYKDANIPEEVTLVGPALLDPRIFEDFKGNWILPFRVEVAEYKWLQYLMNAQGHTGMLIGTSCAHVAFGMAAHIGASPIILIGQDLAYGADESVSHVSDTIYDTLEKAPTPIKNEDYTDGYYGGKVKTTEIWLMFKMWYEKVISDNNFHVINATEGGAKIENTIPMPFKEAIEKYCVNNIDSIYQNILETPNYEFSAEYLKGEFEKELSAFENIRKEAETRLENHQKLEINALTLRTNLNNIQKQLDEFDLFVQKSTSHLLMVHNLQGFILKTSWDISAVEDIISVDNLLALKGIQVKFLIVIISTSEKIEALFKGVIERLETEISIYNN